MLPCHENAGLGVQHEELINSKVSFDQERHQEGNILCILHTWLLRRVIHNVFAVEQSPGGHVRRAGREQLLLQVARLLCWVVLTVLCRVINPCR